MPLYRDSPLDTRTEAIAESVVDAVGTVRAELGLGLLERAYAAALQIELADRRHVVESEVAMPFVYHGRSLPGGYKLDLWVDRSVVIECKAVEELKMEHYAQLATYLRLSGSRLGFLVNFHAVPLRTGIKRVVV